MEYCKTCNFEDICEMPDFVRNDLRLCKVYEPKKKKTNADRIRSMSDDELADFLSNFAWDNEPTKEETYDWLQSEVEE